VFINKQSMPSKYGHPLCSEKVLDPILNGIQVIA